MITIRGKELFDVSTMKELLEIRDNLNLTDRQQLIFMLRFNRGFTLQQIADDERISLTKTRYVSDEIGIIVKKYNDYKKQLEK